MTGWKHGAFALSHQPLDDDDCMWCILFLCADVQYLVYDIHDRVPVSGTRYPGTWYKDDTDLIVTYIPTSRLTTCYRHVHKDDDENGFN